MIFKYGVLERRLPIKSERLRISLLGKQDIKWYAKEVLKEYFGEYIDHQFTESLTEMKLRLLPFALVYKTNNKINTELRFVIKDIETKERYGGVTVYPREEDGYVEVSYWVNPDYQGKGIGTEALQSITQFIHKNFTGIKGTKVIIQERNKVSIHMAQKCGYVEREKVMGKHCMNMILYKDI